MTNFTTVSDPLELQILLKDQTATEILFQSYAATTTIDRMTWLACISHCVGGHVHKIGHNYNGTPVAPLVSQPSDQETTGSGDENALTLSRNQSPADQKASQNDTQAIQAYCFANSRLPITRTFEGNRKKVLVIGSSSYWDPEENSRE